MRYLPLAALCLAATSALAADEPLSLAREVRIPSQAFGEERSIVVHLPPRYVTDPTARYPVLYLTDGDAQFLHTATTADFLARNGRTPELIVIGIPHKDRTHELTTTPNAEEAKLFPTAGAADQLLQFIETEVVPWADKELRTQPYRILAGHSFGGQFALHAFASRPRLFQAAIAVSPALEWNDDAPTKEIERALGAASPGPRALFVTTGDEGEKNDKAHAALRKILEKKAPADLRWDMARFPDDDHGSVVMPSHWAGLRHVFAGLRLPRTADVDGVRAHGEELKKRFGFAIPPAEAEVNQVAYGALARGEHAKAIALFRLNVETYPLSANTYDSLAEALQTAGRNDEAKVNFAKAVEVAEKTKDRNLALFRARLAAAQK